MSRVNTTYHRRFELRPSSRSGELRRFLGYGQEMVGRMRAWQFTCCISLPAPH